MVGARLTQCCEAFNVLTPYWDFTEDIGGFDAADIDRDLIAERLKHDAVSF